MTARRLSVPARLAIVFLAELLLVAIFADLLASETPLLSRHDGSWTVTAPAAPDEAPAVWALVRAGPETLSVPRAGPSSAHPFGTDAQGRDVFSCTVHGARSVVVLTLGVLALGLALGVPAGLWVGGAGPLADAILARSVEVTGALPTLVVLAIVSNWDGLPWSVGFIGVVGVLMAVRVARLVRGEVLRVSAQDFVMAARALGASPAGIARRHVLPHVLGPVLVSAAFSAAAVVGLEAALSFVGLGAAHASWGSVLGQLSGLSWIAILAPTTAIVLTTGALYAVACELDAKLLAR